MAIIMMIGIPNPNSFIPVEKVTISYKLGGSPKTITVLYNPDSYSLERDVSYSDEKGLGSNAPSSQFLHGGAETLSMELFFDTYSAGFEAGGSPVDKAALKVTSFLPSSKKLDVRKFTSQIADLMLIDGDTHSPPLLNIKWKSLQFTGHLISCTQKFTKFNETGAPVRATLSVKFKAYKAPGEIAKMTPLNSPDTAKSRVIHPGDSLWALSAEEYGDTSSWREIARENNIDNPRILETGGSLRLPAL
jgi:hypothetical protein